MKARLQDAIAYIRTQSSVTPVAGIVLGSGLGNFTANMEIEVEIPYGDIPNFPVSTVEGHKGRMILGKLDGKPIVVMAGRFHFYEGYSVEEVVFPIRVLKMMGIQTLFISNAAGGVHPDFEVGDLMIINDHISFFTPNPLVGPNDPEMGPRFPDMSEPYNKELIAKAKAIGAELNIRLHEGVYTGVTGPTFETRAEYRLIQLVGGHAVGMSTVQEVITAVHMGLKVFAISVITDLGIREEDNVITHEEVLAAAKAAEPKLTALFRGLIARG
ncbi:purine-nucleoside phosphorylase [Parasegetibacter sp. NRK P23]|uniref:purine-nucleoside phosphorylase n=1 Tax=Parasegetibacter sp. NRK P23 TaxID=2942999 RepID=UPI002042E395|nr:purine-nucleoside phosphorylase [Parasegetibacter sp. NRK P23]MCM5526885.1 purine-nucleoside phosphorylase [Parasegetibacter sp. NRK P23]